jgi:hypothetical protein
MSYLNAGLLYIKIDLSQRNKKPTSTPAKATATDLQESIIKDSKK